MNTISFCLILVNGLVEILGIAVSFATVCYMMKIFCRYRSLRTESDPDELDPHNPIVVDKDISIYYSVKSTLQVLMILFITDLIFDMYHVTLLSILALKIYLTPGCYPEVFVQIRNYLGTTTNFIYSYHCLGVLNGMSVCLIFLLQNTMQQTVKFMWRVCGLFVMYMTAR